MKKKQASGPYITRKVLELSQPQQISFGPGGELKAAGPR